MKALVGRGLWQLLCGFALLLSMTAAQADPARCVAPAAEYHKVNDRVLYAILAIESGFKASAVSVNKNGSVDVGIAGINSIHFPELAKHGIGPQDLKDPCVSTYVAAWKLAKKMRKWGNTWFGVAAYHSETPYFNNRYQILLQNQMIRLGFMQGRILPVPPLRPQ